VWEHRTQVVHLMVAGQSVVRSLFVGQLGVHFEAQHSPRQVLPWRACFGQQGLVPEQTFPK